MLDKVNRSKKAIIQWKKKQAKERDHGITKKTDLLKSLLEKQGADALADINQLQTEISSLMEDEELKWKQLAKEHCVSYFI
jgi:hypothetical protein